MGGGGGSGRLRCGVVVVIVIGAWRIGKGEERRVTTGSSYTYVRQFAGARQGYCVHIFLSPATNPSTRPSPTCPDYVTPCLSVCLSVLATGPQCRYLATPSLLAAPILHPRDPNKPRLLSYPPLSSHSPRQTPSVSIFFRCVFFTDHLCNRTESEPKNTPCGKPLSAAMRLNNLAERRRPETLSSKRVSLASALICVTAVWRAVGSWAGRCVLSGSAGRLGVGS